MRINLPGFLNEKIKSIYRMNSSELRKKFPDLNIDISVEELRKKMNEGTLFYGFTPKPTNNYSRGDFILTNPDFPHLKIELRFSNSNNHKPVFYVSIDETWSNWFYVYFNNISSGRNCSDDSLKIYIYFLYILAYEIGNIEKSFYAYSANFEKEEKIKEISKNSIEVWLAATLKDRNYTYYISKEENKAMLSIRMKNGTQLDIPVYYKKFRKIMPNLIETIEKYEQMIDNTSVKVLISNLKIHQKWNK